MVGDVVVGLKPNPLLPFGEESVVTGLSFAILHYYGHIRRQRKVKKKLIIVDQLPSMTSERDGLTVFMAFGQCLQVIYMVVVIS